MFSRKKQGLSMVQKFDHPETPFGDIIDPQATYDCRPHSFFSASNIFSTAFSELVRTSSMNNRSLTVENGNT